MFKDYDAKFIIEERQQLKQLDNIYKDVYVFNTKMQNQYHDTRQKMLSYIRELEKQWELDYGEKFCLKNYLSNIVGTKKDNDGKNRTPGLAAIDYSVFEPEDPRLKEKETDSYGGENITREV